MRCLALVVVAAALLGAAEEPAGRQADAEAEAAFRQAFAPQLTPEGRVDALERVVKEHGASRWADDALWVLGEAARQQDLPRATVYYWQCLLCRWPDPELEAHTEELEIYRASKAYNLAVLLDMEGTTYVADGRRRRSADGSVMLNARPANPVAIVAWEELAAAYERLGMLRTALGASRRALAAAPAGGQWASRCQSRTQRLERLVDRQAAAGAAGQRPPAARQERQTGARADGGAPRPGPAPNPAASTATQGTASD
jgi:tetratricopeptide (TPR) repeat protein